MLEAAFGLDRGSSGGQGLFKRVTVVTCARNGRFGRRARISVVCGIEPGSVDRMTSGVRTGAASRTVLRRVFISVAAGWAALVLLFGLGWLFVTRSPTSYCLNAMPTSTEPVIAAASGERTWWPIGVSCEYRGTDFEAVVTPDWSLTLVIASGIVFGTLALVWGVHSHTAHTG